MKKPRCAWRDRGFLLREFRDEGALSISSCSPPRASSFGSAVLATNRKEM